MQQDLNDLYYFAKSIEFGGFAPAGRALGIPKSKLSRRVAILEERLGLRLIQRSTRQFVATEAGRRYYEHCRAMLIEVEAAQESIDTIQAEPQGTIRIACPVGLLKFHAGCILAEFMQKYPKTIIHLESTNRRVDLVAEGIDIALRVRPLPLEDSNLVLRVLSQRHQCLVASPQVLAQYGQPASVEELPTLPSLSRSTEHETHSWHLQKQNAEIIEIRHTPRFTTTDMHALKEAALRGVGIVQLPLLMLSEELQSGSLVKVLPEWAPRVEVIHMVFPSRRGLLPSVRALIDFFAEKYASFDEV